MNWNAVRRLAGPRSWLGSLIGLIVVLLPATILLFLDSARLVGNRELIEIGAAGAAFLGLLLLSRFGAGGVVANRLTAILFLGAFLVVQAAKSPERHAATHLVLGILLVLPLALAALHELLASGSASMRKARFLVHQIANRTSWPTTPEEIRNSPEALSLREHLHDDPTPAIALLGHPRTEVQLAALSALQYRPKWKRLHAQILLQAAQNTTQPWVRSAALTALACVDDGPIVNAIVPYLRDATMEVRRAAAGALLWKPDKRWVSIRHGLRGNLNDPKCARDGAFPCLTTLPIQAIHDLTIWSGEIGSVGQRSTLTLIQYYRRAVREDRGPGIYKHLAQQLVQSNVPAAVRVEIGHLLRDQSMIGTDVADKLLGEIQPGPLRIIAADVLLSEGSNPRAVEVLKEIARQPNRELALAAAVVIQRSLRIDVGLPLGEAPPAPSTKAAAEVVRKVMQWAAQHDQEPKKDDESIDFDLPTPRSPSRV